MTTAYLRSMDSAAESCSRCPCQGTAGVPACIWHRIVTEWLPASGYKHGNAPDVEVYLNPDPQNAQYEVRIQGKRSKVGTPLFAADFTIMMALDVALG